MYIPPHLNATRNGAANDHRYSKDSLVQYFRSQQESETVLDGLSSLYVGGWEPTVANGASNSSWGRREEHKESHNADLCWDRSAHMFPLNLHAMTDEEREVSKTRPRRILLG